jgi:hypothetical protein
MTSPPKSSRAGTFTLDLAIKPEGAIISIFGAGGFKRIELRDLLFEVSELSEETADPDEAGMVGMRHLLMSLFEHAGLFPNAQPFGA